MTRRCGEAELAARYASVRPFLECSPRPCRWRGPGRAKLLAEVRRLPELARRRVKARRLRPR